MSKELFEKYVSGKSYLEVDLKVTLFTEGQRRVSLTNTRHEDGSYAAIDNGRVVQLIEHEVPPHAHRFSQNLGQGFNMTLPINHVVDAAAEVRDALSRISFAPFLLQREDDMIQLAKVLNDAWETEVLPNLEDGLVMGVQHANYTMRNQSLGMTVTMNITAPTTDLEARSYLREAQLGLDDVQYTLTLSSLIDENSEGVSESFSASFVDSVKEFEDAILDSLNVVLGETKDMPNAEKDEIFKYILEAGGLALLTSNLILGRLVLGNYVLTFTTTLKEDSSYKQYVASNGHNRPDCYLIMGKEKKNLLISCSQLAKATEKGSAFLAVEDVEAVNALLENATELPEEVNQYIKFYKENELDIIHLLDDSKSGV